MSSSTNSFKNLIESFSNICSYLEADAEMRLKQISDDRSKELNLSAETIKRFDDLVGDLSETCSELIVANDMLHSLNKGSEDHFLPMPYSIQADTVKNIKELFNITPLPRDSNIEKLDIEQQKELLRVLVASAEKNISDIKDAENIALEVKGLL